MNDSDQQFRTRLLAAETGSPSERYRQNLANLRERKISNGQRVTILMLIVFCVSSAIRMVNLAFKASHGLPIPAQMGLSAGAAALVVVAILMGKVVKRGAIQRTSNPLAMQRTLMVVLGIALGAGTFLALGQADQVKGTQILVLEAIMLLIGGLFLMQSLVEQAELRIREKLLEIEMRIEETGLRPVKDEAAKP